MNQQLALRVAFLVAAVTAPAAAQCNFDVREGQIITVHSSEKAGAIFLADLRSDTQEDCQIACCSQAGEVGASARCNLAVFSNRTRGTNKAKNCFLVYCPSEDACKLSPVSNFSATFVTQSTLTVQEITLEDETTQSSTLLPEEDLTSSASPEKAGSSAASGDSTPKPSSAPSQSSLSSTSGSPEASSLDTFQRYLDVNQTMTLNDTDASVDESEEDLDADELNPGSTRTVIASNGALIAAMCFGVLFLLAVLVVMSKHWYEAYQRRHYSKVDYLINGMYK